MAVYVIRLRCHTLGPAMLSHSMGTKAARSSTSFQTPSKVGWYASIESAVLIRSSDRDAKILSVLPR